MVVNHRSRSSSQFETLEYGKVSLPYGDIQALDRSSSSGSFGSQRQRSRLEDEVLGGGVSTTSSRSDIQAGKKLSAVLTLIKISFFIAMSYALYSLRTELAIRDENMAEIRRERSIIEAALLQSEARVDDADISLEYLQSQLATLLPETDGKALNDEALYQKISDRITAMKDRVFELEDTISVLHRGQAMEHFGHHRYRVMINLQIDGGVYSFIAQMAPLELMPHSVHSFMEMVALQAFDDTIFSHKQAHILLAEFRDSKGNDKKRSLEEKGITGLSFPEYSKDYPHVKYTLGFSGRPGGPEFYINTAHNIDLHGPGGQAASELAEEADSCFAKVTEGNNVIDWMITRNESEGPDSFTVIESIRIIDDDDQDANNDGDF